MKAIYWAVEPWVEYGFELASYAVGWVPYVGWLAPQVMYFYYLGERIVRSAIFNTTEWLTGQGSFIENLGQFGVDTVNSFIYFANDQIGFWLPPLPPIPPLPGGSNTFTVLDASALLQTVQTVEKRVTAPVDLAGTAFGLSGNVKGSPFAAPVVKTQVTDLKLAEEPSPADTSNPLRKVDPFNITTDILKRSRVTTITPDSRKPLLDPLRDVTNTPIGTTTPSAGVTTKDRLTDVINGRLSDAFKGPSHRQARRRHSKGEPARRSSPEGRQPRWPGHNRRVSNRIRVLILGSTGSIGTQALEVIAANPDRFEVVGLAAGGANAQLLADQRDATGVTNVAVADESAADAVGAIHSGPDAATELVRNTEADVVLNALVGALGLKPTLAALDSGARLALANKESLIAGGPLVLKAAKPGQIVPVDSEHSALAQCLRAGKRRQRSPSWC